MLLPPLQKGILLKRYKRFLADIDFNGQVETVHCPNPGAMTGVNSPGMTVWCSSSDNPKRKLPKTLELIEADSTLVGVNTNRPNAIAAEALEAKIIPELADYTSIKREFLWQKGVRFDFRLDAAARIPPMALEVKNAQLRRPQGPNPDAVEFPDAVTARGSKHLLSLIEAKKQGFIAALLFVLQRMDGERFCLADDIDPVYAENLREAHLAGVMIMAWRCQITSHAITLNQAVPITLP